ncbi:LOW QUALITY PROTEIN: E3 ubiquitin-protein ligase TRIM62-like [Guaruba guarouba]
MRLPILYQSQLVAEVHPGASAEKNGAAFQLLPPACCVPLNTGGALSPGAVGSGTPASCRGDAGSWMEERRQQLPACSHSGFHYWFLFHFPSVTAGTPPQLGLHSDAVTRLEMEPICANCLDTYLELVTLSCGHSFGRDCTQEECPQDPYRCLLCHTQADPEEERPEVQCEEKGESLGQQDGVILCDFCIQEHQPAVKTGMNCKASLCQAHLSMHCTKSPEAHVLAERRCPQHGRLLQCYCATDSVCICMLCCIVSSHKDHEITALEEAFGKAQGFFPETLEAVKTHEAALNQSIGNLLKQEEEVKNEESLRRDWLESLFKEMCLQLGNTKEEVLKALSHNEEQQLSWIQMEIQKHKEGKDAASCDVQKLEALRYQKDLLLFIKAFSAIQARERKPVSNDADLKPKPPIILDKYQPTVPVLCTVMPVHFDQKKVGFPCLGYAKQHTMLMATPRLRLYHLRETSTAGNVTELKCITCKRSHSPTTYAIFHMSPLRKSRVHNLDVLPAPIPQLKSNESFSEGCHFWEVDISDMTHWMLGIACPTFQRYLEASCRHLSLFLDKTLITGEHFPTALEVIRVEVDCERNRLSFYNVSVKDGDPTDSLHLIEAVSIPFSYPVHAIFKISEGSLKLL